MIDKGSVLRELDNMLALFDAHSHRNELIGIGKPLDASARSWTNGYTLAYCEAANRVRELIKSIAVEPEQDNGPSR